MNRKLVRQIVGPKTIHLDSQPETVETVNEILKSSILATLKRVSANKNGVLTFIKNGGNLKMNIGIGNKKLSVNIGIDRENPELLQVLFTQYEAPIMGINYNEKDETLSGFYLLTQPRIGFMNDEMVCGIYKTRLEPNGAKNNIADLPILVGDVIEATNFDVNRLL